MLSRLLPRRRPQPIQAQLPLGRRIYAIGDIHGRLDLLDQLLDQIAADDAARGAAQTGFIFLGDLVDRGPDSAGVVDRVRDLCKNRPDVRCLCGNHEEIFLGSYDGDTDLLRLLLRAGGHETLLSYGMDADEIERATIGELAEMMVRDIPEQPITFLRSLQDYIVEGDYLFVHAGIRPGLPLEQQKSRDLRWIRDPFLDHTANHGKFVVHGHTISERVDERVNRIGIDTGAYRTGRLTALGMEGGERWIIDTVDDNRSLPAS
ncbi:metallophosphoesterase family protein [Sphingomonas jeddahensis]|uniref:Serine/threonine-protein phosphatase 1 n=1 Tax=Sphingomonas jeddahensis TaxID=1915074 RepID=A0A1V2EWY8_9SPHN|nr:metallophosphoesterase family protein [Sphingomonas jeddahensis]ONF97053.1 Serine/threonine-protein phosphatase 1 [Sphingomonas jeddahensis]